MRKTQLFFGEIQCKYICNAAEQYYHTYTYRKDNTMKKLVNTLMRVFTPSLKDTRSDYLIWAKTEFKKDWQFAYQHMLDNRGQAPKRADVHNQNDNLKGWV